MSIEGQSYADAIMDAVETVAHTSGKSNLNDLLAALIAVQAHFIGGIGDKKLRLHLQKQASDALNNKIAEQVKGKTAARVKISNSH